MEKIKENNKKLKEEFINLEQKNNEEFNLKEKFLTEINRNKAIFNTKKKLIDFKSENLNKRSTGIQGLLQIANGDPSVLDTLLESFESSSDQKELLLAFNDKSHAMWDFSGSVAKTNHSQMIKRKLDLSDLLWMGFSWLVLASIAFYFVSIAGISNAISFLVGVFVQAFMYVVVVLIPDSLSPIKVIIFKL